MEIKTIGFLDKHGNIIEFIKDVSNNDIFLRINDNEDFYFKFKDLEEKIKLTKELFKKENTK